MEDDENKPSEIENTQHYKNKPSPSLLEQDIKNRNWIYYTCFLVLGLVNNTGYVLVGTSASQLSRDAGVHDLMPLIQLCLISFSGLTRFTNAKYLIKIRHSLRISINTGIMVSGYLMVALAEWINGTTGFALCLFGAVLNGVTSAFGEVIMLGYLKNFPSHLVGAWSSGTGCAGVFGAGIYLALKGGGLGMILIYLCVCPASILYFFAFFYVNRKKAHFQKLEAENAISQEPLMTPKLLENDVDEASENLNVNWVNIKKVGRIVIFLCLNLAAVYFLEYCLITCFTDRTFQKINKGKSNIPYYRKEAYAISCLCYQIGVMISRSSLSIIKIRRIEIVTILQLINFILGLIMSILIFTEYFSVMFIFLVWVGLMGGSSYVNVMYLIVSKPELHVNMKELAANMCTFFNDTGILLAASVSLIFDNTFLKD